MIARYGRRSSQDGPIKAVIGFDSFDGLLSAWSNHAKGTFARTNSAPPPLPLDCTNVTFVQGLFADSLPAFAIAIASSWSTFHRGRSPYSETHVLPHAQRASKVNAGIAKTKTVA